MQRVTPQEAQRWKLWWLAGDGVERKSGGPVASCILRTMPRPSAFRPAVLFPVLPRPLPHPFHIRPAPPRSLAFYTYPQRTSSAALLALKADMYLVGTYRRGTQLIV